jgi:hypothetical protein
MFGRLYLGAMRIDADPFTDITKNLTTLRCEVKALSTSATPRALGESRHRERVQGGQRARFLQRPALPAGETLEARKDEDMEGFLQAGYVAAESKSKRRSRK